MNRSRLVATVAALLIAGAAHAQEEVDALHRAAAAGLVPDVTALLAKGVPVDAKSRAGNTALHLAAAKGHVAVVEALLAKGADPNAFVQRVAAIHLAAQEGQAKVIELLLAKGVDVNSPSQDDRPPVNYAALAGKLEAVKLLVAHKA